MKDQLLSLLTRSQSDKFLYRPQIFKLTNNSDRVEFKKILDNNQSLLVFDQIESQTIELLKIRHPSISPQDSDFDLIKSKLLGDTPHLYGVWVYYPWSNKMIHILDKREFIEVRTNRNVYKITPTERNELATKKIGIIGLSVGNNIALTLATERVCGEMYLADFDELELSNLNRIRADLTQIGLKKTILTARQIAEIDPYISVKCFHEGINVSNIDSFLVDEKPLDLLIEVCDSLSVKLRSRESAKKQSIPVLMDTSDRGMIDIERFDLNPDLPILHGNLQNFGTGSLDKLKTTAEKLPYLDAFITIDNLSYRAKASMIEVGESINSWPQLSSAVTFGAGITAYLAREVLLGNHIESRRYYVDLNELLNIEKGKTNKNNFSYHSFDPNRLIEQLHSSKPLDLPKDAISLDVTKQNQLVATASQAPSSANHQPWEWIYHDKGLHLFINQERSNTFVNFQYYSSYISLGASIKNCKIKAHEMGYSTKVIHMPFGDTEHIASLYFVPNDSPKCQETLDKVPILFETNENRNPSKKKPIPSTLLDEMRISIHANNDLRLRFITDKKEIETLAQIVANADRLKMLHPKSQQDFINKEICWTEQECIKKGYGLHVKEVGHTPAGVIGLKLLKDSKVTNFLLENNLGSKLEKLTNWSVSQSSAIGLITCMDQSPTSYLRFGEQIQDMWIKAQQNGFGIQPLYTPIQFFDRLNKGSGTGFSSNEAEQINQLQQLFNSIFQLNTQEISTFLFRITSAPKPSNLPIKLNINQIFKSQTSLKNV